jgi:Uma2 family endonuclease
MVATRSPVAIPYDLFLVMENESGEKYEWVDGTVYAMTRGTPKHGRLAGTGSIHLFAGALTRGCAVFNSDTAIFIEPASLHTYADAVLVCGPLVTRVVHDKNGKSIGEAIVNPTVIVEVLSESTEQYDRTEKFEAYKLLPSLEQYVLISQDERRIEVRTRRPGRKPTKWAVAIGKAGDTIAIHGHPVLVDAVYDDPTTSTTRDDGRTKTGTRRPRSRT